MGAVFRQRLCMGVDPNIRPIQTYSQLSFEQGARCWGPGIPNRSYQNKIILLLS